MDKQRSVLMAFFLLGALMFTSGCSVFKTHANQTSFFKSEVSKGGENTAKIISVDAKQRIIIEKLEKRTDSAGKEAMIRMYCAEPSPDALSATAGVLTAAYRSSSGRSIDIGKALTESAKSIGLRTQSIQLMRDAMYRNCEGYFSGALTRSQFDQALTRFQILMSGLLAIEQATGAIRAPAVSLNAGSPSQEHGKKIEVLKEIGEHKKQLAELGKGRKELEVKLTDAIKKGATSSETTIREQIAEKDEEISEKNEKLYDRLSKFFLNSLTSNVDSQNLNQWRATEGSVKEVMDAVKTITKYTLDSIGIHNKFEKCVTQIRTLENDLSKTEFLRNLSYEEFLAIIKKVGKSDAMPNIFGESFAQIDVPKSTEAFNSVKKTARARGKRNASLLEKLIPRCLDQL